MINGALLGVLILISCVWVAARVLHAGSNLMVGLSLGLFTYYFVVRAVLVAVGAGTLIPDFAFRIDGDDEAVAQAALALSLWLVLFTLGCRWMLDRTAGPSRLVPSLEVVPAAVWRRVSISLSLMTALLVALLYASYGGFDALARANKLDKSFAGLFGFRAIPQLGATSSMIVVFRTLHTVGITRRSMIYTALAVANGAALYAVGIRTTIGVVILVLVVGWSLFIGRRAMSSPRRTPRSTKRLLVGGTLAAVLVVGVLVSLRTIRDEALTGRPDVTGSEPFADELSRQINLIYFDSFALARRDFPSTYGLRDGTDLISAVSSPVPRAIWSGKPAETPLAVWFRQIYEPKAVNGWPSGAPGQWYLNFGVFGLVVGGAASGLLVGFLANRLRAARLVPDEFVLAAVYVLGVIETGLSTSTLSGWILWVLPLIAVCFLSRRPGAVTSGNVADSVALR